MFGQHQPGHELVFLFCVFIWCDDAPHEASLFISAFPGPVLKGPSPSHCSDCPGPVLKGPSPSRCSNCQFMEKK